ncbi:hypothetical protein GCM10028784_02630 [Myceligenerans cantabricum]
MSETPQTPGAEPNPQPGSSPQPEPTPQPNYNAQPDAGAPQQPGGQQPYAGAPQPGQQQPHPGQPVYGPVPLRPDEERTWAVLAHVGGVILSFIAPLVIWLVFKDRSRFVDAEAKEALNFQITLVMYEIAVLIISAVTLGLGSILYLALIAALVFMILAAVETSKGRPYRYPLNVRLVK